MKGGLVKGSPLLLLVLMLLFSQPVLAPEIGRWRAYIAEQPDEDAGNVRYVTAVDGDTVRLENGTYVRLVGYDAYELSEPKGPEAKKALENLSRRGCLLDVDDLEPFDKYGRKLGYLWCLDFIFLPDPPIWPAGMSHYINVAKWFLTDGREYVKRELYIPPDEHPWWTWLARHHIAFKGLYPSCSLTVYNMTKIESYSFSGDYTLSVLSGNYEIGVAYFALNLTYNMEVRRVNLISSTSKSSTIDVSKSSFYAAFVRGADNRIYYTVCNYSRCAHTWTQVWRMVNYLTLPGSTVDAPSATTVLSPFGARARGIHLAVRGGDDSIWYGYLYEAEIEPGNVVFSGWQRLSGSTPSRPAIVTDGIRVYLVVRGKDNHIYFNILEGGKWKGWQRLPTGSTIDAPAAAYLQGRLHIVVRGRDGYSLWHSWIDLSTGGFSGWARISGSTPSAPYLTTDGSRLYLAVRGGDNGIYYNVYDGSRWLGWSRLPTGSTPTTPAILIGKGVIHFVVVGMDGRSIYYTYKNLTTGESFPWNRLPGSTTSPVALTSLELSATPFSSASWP